MGSFSIWHWVIVLVVLCIPLGIGLVIWLIVRAARRPVSPTSSAVPFSAAPQPSAEARLQELASLRAKGLITESEHEEQRSEVLRSV